MSKAKHPAPLTLDAAFAALVAKECRSLLRAMAMQRHRHEGIHRARKSCRKLRSLLGFLGPQPTKKTIALDNALRRLLHQFSALRDAHIAQRTARLLASAHAAKLTPALLKMLQGHTDELLRHALKADPDWRHKRSRAEHWPARLQALPWEQITPAKIKEVIANTSQRAKKARKKAMEYRTPEAFHRWRRRARKLRYQLELASAVRTLSGMKKSRSKRYSKRAKKLVLTTDRLGWRQDFQVFLQTLDQLGETSVEAAALSHTLKRKSLSAAGEDDLPAKKPKQGDAYVAKVSAMRTHPAKRTQELSPAFDTIDKRQP